MHQLNKFYLILTIAVVIAGSIFTVQIMKAKKITVKPNVIPILSEGYYDIPTENDDQILGNPGAPLTVVLFSDSTCPVCKLKYYEISKFVKEHPQDVRLFVKNVPSKNLFYKTNDLPHRSAYCAGKQGKYWQYLDILNTQKNTSSESDLTKIADGLKLNTINWWQCVNSEDAKQKISRTVALAATLGVEQTPTIYVNNKKINLENEINITELLSKFIVK